MRGLGGAAINVPEDAGTAGGNSTGTGLKQFSFSWWNGAVPLIAIIGLFGLSRMRFGVSADELKAIVEAQGAPSLRMPSAPPPAARAVAARARQTAAITDHRAPRRREIRRARGWWQSIASIRCRRNTR